MKCNAVEGNVTPRQTLHTGELKEYTSGINSDTRKLRKNKMLLVK